MNTSVTHPRISINTPRSVKGAKNVVPVSLYLYLRLLYCPLSSPLDARHDIHETVIKTPSFHYYFLYYSGEMGVRDRRKRIGVMKKITSSLISMLKVMAYNAKF
jgi:hypothetical protein